MKDNGLLSFLKDSLFSEECALRGGLLQSLDPRIKVLGFALILVSALLARSIGFIFCLYLLSLCLALFSGIKLGFFLKRTWVFIPLFSLIIGLPALFSNFTPGEELLRINLGSFSPAISVSGVFTFFLFVLRVAATVSFAVLLSMTTRHFQLLKVLRIFGIPQVFVMVLGICYRYLYLLVEIVENTYLAVRSRVGAGLHYRAGQQVAGWNIAFLWMRSYRLSENVYMAMLSRGYRGQVHVLEDFKTGLKDWLWLIFTAALIICTLRFFH
ncbi:MAG: cobalt ECF transporter T component CbiQ [Candidatus Omnitrophica bacterium]|nr:cobalt ECF transporter T component CbiQ [Candidatus Omnitrophota bacterium]